MTCEFEWLKNPLKPLNDPTPERLFEDAFAKPGDQKGEKEKNSPSDEELQKWVGKPLDEFMRDPQMQNKQILIANESDGNISSLPFRVKRSFIQVKLDTKGNIQKAANVQPIELCG